MVTFRPQHTLVVMIDDNERVRKPNIVDQRKVFEEMHRNLYPNDDRRPDKIVAGAKIGICIRAPNPV